MQINVKFENIIFDGQILIEPQWNVDYDSNGDINIDVLILIEPQWNVDLENIEVLSLSNKILIEPQWNVDLSTSLSEKSNEYHFNRTIVECRYG